MILENFKIEIFEIFRVQNRAIKIHVYLWAIIILLFISEIVRKFATSFMFTVFIFVEIWMRYRASGWAWGWRWRLPQKCVCLMYLFFYLYKRMYSHPSGRSARLWLEGPGFEPQWYPFEFFHIFFHTFWLFWTSVGLRPWALLFFLLSDPLFHLHTLAHFYFFFLILFIYLLKYFT